MIPPAFVWALMVGDGLMAGVFFAFSIAIMPALRRVPATQAIAVMQVTNRAIVNPVFLLVFLGTALLNLGALPMAWWVGSLGLALSALIYLLGALAVTVAGNIPRNNALDRLDPLAPTAPGLLGALPARVDAAQSCADAGRNSQPGGVGVVTGTCHVTWQKTDGRQGMAPPPTRFSPSYMTGAVRPEQHGASAARRPVRWRRKCRVTRAASAPTPRNVAERNAVCLSRPT